MAEIIRPQMFDENLSPFQLSLFTVYILDRYCIVSYPSAIVLEVCIISYSYDLVMSSTLCMTHILDI